MLLRAAEGADARQVVGSSMTLPLKPELDRAIVESAVDRPAPPAADAATSYTSSEL
jgi:hypothetical protein